MTTFKNQQSDFRFNLQMFANCIITANMENKFFFLYLCVNENIIY